MTREIRRPGSDLTDPDIQLLQAPAPDAPLSLLDELDAALKRVDDTGLDPRSKEELRLGMELCHRLRARLAPPSAVAPKASDREHEHDPTDATAATVLPLEASPMPELTGISALVIEPGVDDRKILCQMLEHLGATVHVATSPSDIRALLETRNGDLVLLAAEAADAEVIAALSENNTTPLPPHVLILTTGNEDIDVLRATFGGGCGVLTKPVMSLPNFAAEVAGVLATRSAPQGSPTRNAIDVDRFRALLEMAGDAHREELLTQIEVDLKQTSSALQQALDRTDMAKMRAATHALVSLVGTLGAWDAMVEIQRMNQLADQFDTPEFAELAPIVARNLEQILTEVQTEARISRGQA